MAIDPRWQASCAELFAELKDKYTGYSSIAGEDIYTRNGTASINDIFGERKFDFPKPFELIEQFVDQSTEPGDLIMDSFAGSGTTGHAVLNHNKLKGGARRFILVEMDREIAEEITSERLKRVILGYDKGGDPSKPVEGLGGDDSFPWTRQTTPRATEVLFRQ